MSPVRYVDYTRSVFASQGFPPYEWIVNGPPPFTPFDRDLKECRVALLSTGGFYIKGKQPPFDPEKNDLGLREIPRDIDVTELAVSHDYYDHADADRDVNCVFPIERFRELEAEGYFDELARVNYTIMGRIFRRTALVNETAQEIVNGLKQQEVDVFFLVPA
jgi:D-proline reductase (dithiol) PrdB